MNTGLIQTLLESIQALQASVKAIEAKLDNPSTMVALTTTEAPESGLQAVELPMADEEPIKKHPLEDYKITEKDVGSLCIFTRSGVEEINILHTFDNGDTDYPFRTKGGYWRRSAEPYLDPIKLHFRPFYATPDSVAPDDLGEHFAILWNDGEIIIYSSDSNGLPINSWKRFEDEDDYMIGYRPLKFVNPLKD